MTYKVASETSSLYSLTHEMCVKADLNGKLELVVKLSNELVVCQRLTHLHDTNDGCVDLVLAVLEHALSCTHVLFMLLTQTETLNTLQVTSETSLHRQSAALIY